MFVDEYVHFMDDLHDGISKRDPSNSRRRVIKDLDEDTNYAVLREMLKKVENKDGSSNTKEHQVQELPAVGTQSKRWLCTNKHD